MTRPRRFTLVELLVAIAIISILAGMLLPALGRARSAGLAAACASNLRQMGMAEGLYLAEYGYFIPCYGAEFSMGSAGGTWLGYRSATALVPGDSSTRPMDMTQGFMGPYLEGAYRAMACPSWPWPGDIRQVVGGAGYGYNVYGVGSPAFTGTRNASGTLNAYGHGAGLKDGAARRPSRLLAFADACEPKSDGTAQGYFIIYPKAYRKDDGTAVNVTSGDQLHFRHDGRAGTLWADGHVERQAIERYRGDPSPSALALAQSIGGFGPTGAEAGTPSYFDPR